jgi:hypothetical protein
MNTFEKARLIITLIHLCSQDSLVTIVTKLDYPGFESQQEEHIFLLSKRPFWWVMAFFLGGKVAGE